jgi:Arc/MetJ-type ribon-helix-helix transcriptional regulator
MEKMTPESLRDAIHQTAGRANAPHTPSHLMVERREYKSKEDALKAGIKDLKRQIANQKNKIDTLADIASPLGPKVVAVYLKKDKAFLANREQLLRELEDELSTRAWMKDK